MNAASVYVYNDAVNAAARSFKTHKCWTGKAKTKRESMPSAELIRTTNPGLSNATSANQKTQSLFLKFKREVQMSP